MGEPAPPETPKFNVRIGRRLSLALGFIVFAMLIAGGASLVVGLLIYRIDKGIDRDFTHALASDEIYETFHLIILEIQHIQSSGEFDGLTRIRELRRALTTNVRAYVDFHEHEKNAVKETREQPLVDKLIRLDGEFRVLLDHAEKKYAAWTRLQPGELEELRHFVDRGVENAQALHDFHRARVLDMSRQSQRFIRLSATLYLIFLVFGGVLVGVASLVLERKITVPLIRVADSAIRIAEGHMDERVPVTGRNEISQLSHAFNVMAGRLQERERDVQFARDRLEKKVREMQSLVQGGLELLSLRDLKTILQSMLDRTRNLLKVDAAAVTLATPGRETLTVFSTSGPPEAFQSSSGYARFSDTCLANHGECRGGCPVVRSGFAQAELSWAIQHRGNAIGVLCVWSRAKQTFGPEEADTLEALAIQVSIAIESARLNDEARKSAVIGEREWLAREMHDGLAQSIGLLHLKLKQAQALAASDASPQVGEALAEMETIADEAYDEIRQSILGLRTMVTRSDRLAPTLTELLHEFSERHGISVKLEADGAESLRLLPVAEVQVIRIVQEALTNVRRHAATGCAWVRVLHDQSWLRVQVEDDGRGFDPTTIATPDGIHFGLKGMRERAEGLDGKLEIASAPGRGTCVTVHLPLEKVS